MFLTVRQLRGGFVETEHPVSVRAVSGGRVVLAAGLDYASFWRSACKPLQLATSLECLPGPARDRLDDADLAIGASSHSGQPVHVARVQRLLDFFGLREADLRCGAHWPMHEASARAVEVCSAIHNNCSGKHTYMLAAAVAQGWDPDYRPATHPLQLRNRQRVAEWGGVAPEEAVDGCGVPTFHVPLSAQARTWAGIAAEMRGDGLTGRIALAMGRHPELVSGDGRLDLAVARAAREAIVGKVGAEGLFCMALPDRDLGVAVKVHTGSAAALAVAVRAALDELAPGALQPAEEWPEVVVRNVVGAEVGARIAAWT